MALKWPNRIGRIFIVGHEEVRMGDLYDLQRFVDAQDRVFEQVCAELREGDKRTHWMWFIFPQIRGLGSSSTAQHYAISTKAEAGAYLNHPVLGPRLRKCTQLVIDVQGRSLREIFGSPDDMKFCSSMTLFAHAISDNQLFLDALQKYCSGRFDPLTTGRL
jgi:uncharacterized protein (DUF1810 family)